MQTWITLFRGINVGGKNILPMAALIEELHSMNLKNVRTYIQSGNAVFESTMKKADSISNKIEDRIDKVFGFRPQVVVLKDIELKQAVSANPYSNSKFEPKSVHFFFMDASPEAANPDEFEANKKSSESFAIVDRVFYLCAPEGIGRSKLAAKAEKLLGVTATARNLRTVQKLLELSAAVPR